MVMSSKRFLYIAIELNTVSSRKAFKVVKISAKEGCLYGIIIDIYSHVVIRKDMRN